MLFGGFAIGKSRFFAGPAVHGFNACLPGEHGLLAAVVWRAVRDLESDNFVLAMDARRFFLAVEPHVPFSFDWIMDHLDEYRRHPNEIRQLLRRLGLL